MMSKNVGRSVLNMPLVNNVNKESGGDVEGGKKTSKKVSPSADIDMSMIARANEDIDVRNTVSPTEDITNAKLVNPLVQRSYSVSVDNLKKMDVMCRKYGSSRNKLINLALELYFEQNAQLL